MPDIKFTFDPGKVKITDGDILADLAYPARSAAEQGKGRRTALRRGRRR